MFMKKRISFVVVAMVVTSFVMAQKIVPSKNYVTKKVEVKSFDGISASTSIDVEYTQTSGNQDVEVYAPDNLVDYVKVEVEDGVLKVCFESKNKKKGITINGKHKTKVSVSAPAVHKLHASSCGDILLKNGLKVQGKVVVKSSSSSDIEGGSVACDELLVKTSSSGDVSLENVVSTSLNVEASSSGDVDIKMLQAETVEAEVSSAGDIELAGVCHSAKFSASSSGDVMAKMLKANVVTAKASSAGDITCHAVDSLDVTTSSSGNVGYKGNPKHIDFHPKKGLKKID
jgi:hypothetical protein